MGKAVIIRGDYHDIGQLLLITIIASSKNCTISIIVKQNIMVNRQNRLIAHPYTQAGVDLGFTEGRANPNLLSRGLYGKNFREGKLLRFFSESFPLESLSVYST